MAVSIIPEVEKAPDQAVSFRQLYLHRLAAEVFPAHFVDRRLFRSLSIGWQDGCDMLSANHPIYACFICVLIIVQKIMILLDDINTVYAVIPAGQLDIIALITEVMAFIIRRFRFFAILGPVGVSHQFVDADVKNG